MVFLNPFQNDLIFCEGNGLTCLDSRVFGDVHSISTELPLAIFCINNAHLDAT